jgi:hypothetical protein
VLQADELEAATQPPADLQDMLLMAFNMPMPAATAAVAAWLPPHAAIAYRSTAAMLCQVIGEAASPAWKQWVKEQLSAQLAGQLFQAAAACDLYAFTALDSIKPGLVPATVFAAIGEVVQQKDTKTLKHLCRLSSAKTCDAELLVAPLLAALRAGYSAGVEEIVGIDGLLQRLTAAHVTDLLLAMLQVEHSYGLFARLVDLPAAQQLPFGSFKALFEAAVQLQEQLLFPFIRGMPAQAAQLKYVEVLAAVQLAVQLQDTGAVQQCLALPAACDPEPDQLRQLFVAVLQLNGRKRLMPLEALGSRPNIHRLSHEMIEDVLKTAFDTSNRKWVVLQWLVPVMCHLPQAGRMQLSSILEWLQLSLAQPAQAVTTALCNLMERTAAQRGDGPGPSFGSREAEGLLVSALPTGTGGSLAGLETVCSLECVRHAADGSTVARVLNSIMAFIVAFRAAGHGTAAAIQLLLQLPAAASMSAPELAQLLASWLPQCHWQLSPTAQLYSSSPAVTTGCWRVHC